jgi:hypothetical protein
MYLKLLYLMYVAEIKLLVLKFKRVTNNLDFIIQSSQVHNFSVVYIAPTIYVVHDA